MNFFPDVMNSINHIFGNHHYRFVCFFHCWIFSSFRYLDINSVSSHYEDFLMCIVFLLCSYLLQCNPICQFSILFFFNCYYGVVSQILSHFNIRKHSLSLSLLFLIVFMELFQKFLVIPISGSTSHLLVFTGFIVVAGLWSVTHGTLSQGISSKIIK